MNQYFNLNESVFDVTERYPDAIRYFVQKGFTPLTNPIMRKMMGKKITVENAFRSKKLDVTVCEQELAEFIAQVVPTIVEKNSTSCNTCKHTSATGETHGTKYRAINSATQTIRIEGVLPCPIRIPLLERFEAFHAEYLTHINKEAESHPYTITYDLRSANLGLDWIIEQVKTGKKDQLPDILLSAGFELFFDKTLMGGFIQNKDFHCTLDNINKDFCNAAIDLRDPYKNYAIIGVVPAIMIVNTDLLNGRKIPETWEDLLSTEFENSVAVPFGDLDLFNSVILNIYARFGDKGIANFGRSCGTFMHPAQMVKTGRKAVRIVGNKNTTVQNIQPAISISPYFFSKMLPDHSPLKTVWPKDGAIIAPIFMLVKKDTEKVTKPFVDFFLSEQTGTVFAQSGFFPSTNPAVNNALSEGQTFSWIGWDFIYRHDIGTLLAKITADFKAIAEKR